MLSRAGVFCSSARHLCILLSCKNVVIYEQSFIAPTEEKLSRINNRGLHVLKYLLIQTRINCRRGAPPNVTHQNLSLNLKNNIGDFYVGKSARQYKLQNKIPGYTTKKLTLKHNRIFNLRNES